MPQTLLSLLHKIYCKTSAVQVRRLQVTFRWDFATGNMNPGSTVCRVCRIFTAAGAPTYSGTSSAHQQRRFGKIGRPKGPKKRRGKNLCHTAWQSVTFHWAHFQIMHCNCIIITRSPFFWRWIWVQTARARMTLVTLYSMQTLSYISLEVFKIIWPLRRG